MLTRNPPETQPHINRFFLIEGGIIVKRGGHAQASIRQCRCRCLKKNGRSASAQNYQRRSENTELAATLRLLSFLSNLGATLKATMHQGLTWVRRAQLVSARTGMGTLQSRAH